MMITMMMMTMMMMIIMTIAINLSGVVNCCVGDEYLRQTLPYLQVTKHPTTHNPIF